MPRRLPHSLTGPARPGGRQRRAAWSVALLAILAPGSWAGSVPAQVVKTPAPAPDSRTDAAGGKTAARTALAFEVGYPAILGSRPITGRVYVFLRPGKSGPEPRLGPDWFQPHPFFASDVRDWKPARPVRIDSAASGYPGPLDTLPAGDYAIQAVVRLNPDTHSLGTGEGNAYGPVVQAAIDPRTTRTITLEVDRLVPPRPFAESDRIKLAELESPLLSAFYHRPIKHRAAVILPERLPKKKLPAVYIIPGFGGDHHMARVFISSTRMSYAGNLVRVVLDPDCGTGHHVFADSASNGPRGRALIEEFIPYLEKTYPLIADPRVRLLNGHSSGGWSSLWLQVTYPDFFGGTWSTSPDPVDFRDFQKINIYETGENMFRDREGKSRPIAHGDCPRHLLRPLLEAGGDPRTWRTARLVRGGLQSAG